MASRGRKDDDREHDAADAHREPRAEDAEAWETERWEVFADGPEADGACPVLDPATGRCALYASRPMTCRVFGPPVEQEEGLGVCELCYVGASEEEMVAGQMRVEWGEVEEAAEREVAGAETVIAWAVLGVEARVRQESGEVGG